jgi:hypothetical protein
VYATCFGLLDFGYNNGARIHPTEYHPMPIHDWTRVDAGIFHDFHHAWIEFDPAKPLTCASYIGGPTAEAFVDPVAVGALLPTTALFLTPEEYVPVLLETTYQAAFEAVPDFWRQALEQN